MWEWVQGHGLSDMDIPPRCDSVIGMESKLFCMPAFSFSAGVIAAPSSPTTVLRAAHCADPSGSYPEKRLQSGTATHNSRTSLSVAHRLRRTRYCNTRCVSAWHDH